MKTPDTKHQKFKAFTELCSSRPMYTKQNSLQSLPPRLTAIHVSGKHRSNITMAYIYNNMELKTKLKEGEGEEHEKMCFGTTLKIAKSLS